jgi:hypothetical protein
VILPSFSFALNGVLMVKLRWFWFVALLWLPVVISAQENPTVLAIRADTANLQTGEYYPIHIEIDNVTELWSATMRIAYDPQLVYIVGTESGAPVQLGGFLTGGLSIQNSINEREGYLLYTPSQLAPADPVSGNGVIGTFLIFPLQAGELTLSFTDADMSSIVFTTNELGYRTVQESPSIPFAVTQLTLTITGDMVTPPPEVTATPTPTVTPFVEQDPDAPPFTPEPTLVVVTDAPPNAESATDETASTPILLYMAVGFVIFALAGLVALFVVGRRGSK